MRKESLFLILIVSLFSCGESVSLESMTITSVNPELDSGHVVFYNVENLFDTHNDPKTNDDWFTPDADTKWDNERYNRKLDQLSKAISWTGKEMPMLIGLAEVETEQCVIDLSKTGALRSANYGHVHYESPDERGIDVALLFRKDAFEVIRSAPIEVKLQDDRTRDVLHVEGNLSGELMHVFVCHWSSRGEGVKETEYRRIAAAEVVRKEVDAILIDDANTSIIIMGDLNDYPTNKSVQNVLNASCNDGVPQSDLVDLMCADHKAGKGSYNYRGDWGYIDHFITSTGLLDGVGWQAGEAKAHWDKRLLFNHPKNGPSPDRTYGGRKYHGGFSDHLPIKMELSR